jgi:DNA-binding CsgD family transcriptional regulator
MTADDPTTRHAPPTSAGEAETVHVLVSVGRDAWGEVFILPNVGAARVGKDDDAEIRVPNSGVSRWHAEVVAGPGSIRVRDTGSTNGTYVGAERVDDNGREVAVGQRILIGQDTRLELRRLRTADLGRLRASIDAARSLRALSDREREVAEAVAAGLTSAKVAKQLGVSPRTITTHLDRIFAKLDLPSRAALTKLVIEARLFPG